METKKAMLSQPMAGKTEQEIRETREKAIAVLKKKGYSVVNTLLTDEWYSPEKMRERGVVQIPLCFLVKSLENMSLCHAAYFCKAGKPPAGVGLSTTRQRLTGLRSSTKKTESYPQVKMYETSLKKFVFYSVLRA